METKYLSELVEFLVITTGWLGLLFLIIVLCTIAFLVYITVLLIKDSKYTRFIWKVKNYILLVDSHKRLTFHKYTEGRYRVAAKTPYEAVELLREKIRFGSIQVYYECRSDDELNVPYKTIVKEVFEGGRFIHEDVC